MRLNFILVRLAGDLLAVRWGFLLLPSSEAPAAFGVCFSRRPWPKFPLAVKFVLKAFLEHRCGDDAQFVCFAARCGAFPCSAIARAFFAAPMISPGGEMLFDCGGWGMARLWG